MPTVSFDKIRVGRKYSRPELAVLWGYAGYQAIARGVVTPRNDYKIVLFVTEEKQPQLPQYKDRLQGSRLAWEGPSDHFAEDRLIGAKDSGEEIHVFYRKRHHEDFTYMGQARIFSYQLRQQSSSTFLYDLR